MFLNICDFFPFILSCLVTYDLGMKVITLNIIFLNYYSMFSTFNIKKKRLKWIHSINKDELKKENTVSLGVYTNTACINDINVSI